ncbi:CBO0543 family protein [Paenibacillus nasutitermitis]|uniref:Uncharacterized protein n=1 Tax=Paenibacillus nasutitermitis TaxID=1652958 RepID=A0A917DZR3_9BACL|nr:CBO0543 family protein [Paenibacillus nasutitermitis]GGD86224.1 hypothetical protein GCM10010911_50800 [Paenibacillus nasutitermitis]
MGMAVERMILAAIWIICIPVLLLFPRERYREVALLFLFNQAITWLSSLVLVELGLMRNPVREFPLALGSNFSLYFMLYPAVSVFFVLFYPRRGKWRKLLYMLLYIGSLTLVISLVARHTLLIRYEHFHWIWRSLVYLGGFYGTRKYYEWFYQLRAKGDNVNGDQS